MAPQPELGDDPLRLPQRVGADQHAAARVGVKAVEQPVDLAAGLRMAEHGQPERRLGDEHVARHGHEAGAGRVGPALVVAGDHDLLALVLQHDLSAAEDMARGHEADVDVADANRLVVGDGLPARLRTVAAFHDRQRLGSREHRAMPAARVIRVAMRDHRPGLASEGSIHASAGRT